MLYKIIKIGIKLLNSFYLIINNMIKFSEIFQFSIDIINICIVRTMIVHAYYDNNPFMIVNLISI